MGELSLMLASQLFSQWRVDLLGPFPVGPGQVKYLIVAIDYYTKWVEAKPLANISLANYKKFAEFLSGLGIKQKFSSAEHPQSNGQVEAANKIILKGLKKWLDQKQSSWADELASIL
ncbi:uncharacterized protein LOC107646727 [Arachis ipaensis]|uniref:uncharacterized protein LOC107646727 n=1 Tax=Arachis ipaensis TaxID=130454 RepID=UPI0007AF44AC|nr:uncharacterized protein LOC107646727 [Arachis ipaensis]XP_025661334.1 uncharacterized protein LOC112756946 [Arachis hypogaea]